MPRLGTWSQPKRRPDVVLEHNGWRGMRTTLSQQQHDPSLAHYLANWMPVDPERGGPLRMRPALTITTATTYSNITLLAQFSTAAGVSTQVMLANGELYTYNANTATYTKQVSAANFGAAVITVSTTAQTYALSYCGKLLVSDGINVPWTWDGTSGGGLVKLTNCPVLYGPPTEYYGKVVGIKNTDRLTFVWSEELQPNLGYDTAPYTNFWTLAQTSTEPLTSLLGTNDGLYYFRPSSVGVVRGAMASDFRTTGVHDEVSRSLGITAPAGRGLYGSMIWFVTPQQSVYVLPFGGSPENVTPADPPDPLTTGLGTSAETGYFDEPMGFGLSHWGRGVDTTPSTKLRVIPVGPSRYLPRAVVFVVLTSYNTVVGAQDQAGALLVYDAETRRPLCWWTPVPSPQLESLIYSAAAWDTGYGGQALVTAGQASLANMVPIWYGRSVAGSGDYGPTGVVDASTIRARLVTAAFTNRAMDEMLFDRASVDFVTTGNASFASTADCTMVTSAKDRASVAPAYLSTTLTFSPVGDEVATQRKVFGFGEPGRWCRVVVQALTNTGSGIGIDGVAVTAVPIGRSAAIA